MTASPARARTGLLAAVATLGLLSGIGAPAAAAHQPDAARTSATAASPAAYERSLTVKMKKPKRSMGKASSWAPMGGTKTHPSRWDRCTPITWKIDFAGLKHQHGKAAPELGRWKSVLKSVSKETGYRFVYRGQGTYKPKGSRLSGREDGIDVIISYAAKTDKRGYRVAQFSGHYGMWGLGGAEVSESVETVTGADGYRLSGGLVVINAIAVAAEQHPRTWTRSRPGRPVAADLIRSLYLHEFGHAMGLRHVTDRQQMMYPSVQGPVPSRYGAGDKAGLHKMGSMACFAPVVDEPPATDPTDPGYPNDPTCEQDPDYCADPGDPAAFLGHTVTALPGRATTVEPDRVSRIWVD